MKSRSRTTPTYVLLALAAFAGPAAVEATTTHRWQEPSMNPVPASRLAGQLRLEAGSELREIRSAPTAHGTRTVRMQQTWKGIPVFGRAITVELDASGRSLKMFGSVDKGLLADLPSTRPRLSAADVRTLWRARSGARSMDAGVEDRQSTLYVYPRPDAAARLVYLVSHFIGGQQPSEPTAFIDANTGEVLKQWEGLAFIDASGPGGNAKTGKYTYGEDRPALHVKQEGAYCTTETAEVLTFDLAKSPAGDGKLWRFLCPLSTGDAVNDGYGPINDLHHHGVIVSDMFKAYLGRAPLSGPLHLQAHFGNRIDNAFATSNGGKFGDGDTQFYPLVSLDIVGHEIGHAFTMQNSGLMKMGPAGAINESFGDILGDAAEWFAYGKSDFLTGREIVKVGDALRNMCEPEKDRGSIGHTRDLRDGMGIYETMGLYTKAYCVLARTDGWNPANAFKVFARANMLYWSEDETYDGGACGVQRSAVDLGFREKDVATAFDAVGVVCR